VLKDGEVIFVSPTATSTPYPGAGPSGFSSILASWSPHLVCFRVFCRVSATRFSRATVQCASPPSRGAPLKPQDDGDHRPHPPEDTIPVGLAPGMERYLRRGRPGFNNAVPEVPVGLPAKGKM
jgi:hypothetical protein